jgi:hypothetical protein
MLPGSVTQARADNIVTGMLYVADYGKSVLDRYQYLYDQTLNSITSMQGFTETTGPAAPNGLSAPKYLQFDTNFVPAPDAGLVPEPGTVTLALAAIAGLGLLKRVSRKCRDDFHGDATSSRVP